MEREMSEDLLRISQAYADAWNSHDWKKVAPFFADDAVFEAWASGAKYQGKEALKAYFEATVTWSKDFEIQLHHSIISGDWLAGEWTMSGTNTGDIPGMKVTGKKYSIQGASVMEFQNGKLKRHADYWSLLTYMQQVGLMPSSTPT
jgi:steroid delta-isomerase-like uncharacterized protein